MADTLIKDDPLTFGCDDRLDRSSFAEHLVEGIKKFSPFADGSYVVSLNASFGSGKTHFLKMLQNYLEENDRHKVVYINAWKTDFAENPAIPIIAELIKELSIKTTNSQIITELTKALGLIGGLANEAIKSVIRVDLLNAIQKAEDIAIKDDLERQGELLFKEYNYFKQAFEKLSSTLKQLAEEQSEPIYILIDELDRARPNYAVELLETIKHLFSVQGIVFILAVDREQLSSSVKVLYGNNTDFDGYYQRFVTRETELPAISDYSDLIEQLYEQNFVKAFEKGIGHPFKQKDMTVICNTIKFIANTFKLKPRKLIYFVRFSAQFIITTEIEGKTHSLIAALWFIALRMFENGLYHQIGAGTASPQAIAKFVNNHISDPTKRSYVLEYLFAYSIDKDNRDNFDMYVASHGNEIRPMSALISLAYNLPSWRDESWYQIYYGLIENWCPLYANN